MEKKKLLVTASTFPRWDGDTEPRFVLDLCKAMNEYFDITVMVPSAPGVKDKEVLEGVKVIRYHYFPIHKFETLCYPGAIVPRIKEKKIRALLVPFLLIGLWNAIRKNIKNYDMVHAHWIIPQGIVQSFFKKPYIVTGHGGDVCSLNKGIIRKLKIRCINNSAYVTVVSEHLKNKVLNFAPTAKVDVISMGIDTSAFGTQYRVENYFGQGDKKVVLFVGRLAEKKGVTYLIEAMKYIDAILVIAGDGPLRSELEEQAYTQALQKDSAVTIIKTPTLLVDSNSSNMIYGKKYGNIVFIGSKSHEELKNIYASADIFCMPSVTAKDGDQEGFGLVMLEAMASGLPVVASNSGGITQLIKNDYNGLLCEEKNIWQIIDNIISLINDPTLYEKLRENGMNTANSYSYNTVAAKYRNLIG